MTKPSPNFRTLLTSVGQGEVVIPIINTYLWNPKFRGFTVKVGGFEERRPDGWFHPSEHPLWPERMLYYYLVEPNNLVKEPFDPHSTMAVTQGNFWHKFITTCLIDAGYLIPPPPDQEEHGFADEATGARGSVDGLTAEEVFEYKTMVGAKARKIAAGGPSDPQVIESFRALAPEYYAQGQEYMRISGYRCWRGIVHSLEYPFPMREITMKYDPFFANEIKQKYLRVRQAVADQRLPLPCCAPKSKQAAACIARQVCPIASM